jgi:hypothetical protein
MGKFGWAVVFVLCAALAADHFLNDGYFTSAAIGMLREIQSHW